MNPKVSIVLLNWNGLEDTSESLQSLQKIYYDNYDVIVVDNNSFGNDADVLNQKFGEFIKKIIIANDNLGFSGGNNLGIKYSLNEGTDFILLLNNDTIVEKNFLNELFSVFGKFENVGISAPQINYYFNPEVVWTAGGVISKIRGSGFAYSDKNEAVIEKKEKIVSFASGCCLLIKKEVFDKIGLLDEDYFLYVEDADFCYRTSKAGYKIIVNPNSKIYHKVGNSTTEGLKQLPLYYTTRNRLFFAKKNFQGFHIVTIIYIFITMLFKSLWWLLKGKSEYILSTKIAFTDFLRGNMGKTNNEKLTVNR